MSKMKISLVVFGLALVAGVSAWAGDCCGCMCPMGKAAYALRAPASTSAAKVVCAQQGKAIVKNLARV